MKYTLYKNIFGKWYCQSQRVEKGHVVEVVIAATTAKYPKKALSKCMKLTDRIEGTYT